MIASMTAFSRQASQSNDGSLWVWELRTVNHRFLDISLRLPESLRGLEPLVRERLAAKIQRGKLEATLRFNAAPEATGKLRLNEVMLKQLADASDKIRQYFPNIQTDMLGLLAWPGVLETENPHLTENTNSAEALHLLQHALDDLVQMREREGAQIRAFIQQRVEALLALIAEVSQQIPQLLETERERIAQRVAELQAHVDTQRLEQEMAIIAQKADIAEEIQRLYSHCQAMSATLAQPGAMGRRLDFLSQELHREANTLSSKALTVSLTQASIEMKVLIEQIREQVQNIE